MSIAVRETFNEAPSSKGPVERASANLPTPHWPWSRPTAELLTDGFTTTIPHAHQELRVLVYPSAIVLSNTHLRYLTRQLLTLNA
ncbi:hypothetical protein [Streptomyces mexicanus]|uniref:hypothetical protein n=1 Tax=Streptomyces mexicanus TaxID=178566 RepID=UPI0036509F83